MHPLSGFVQIEFVHSDIAQKERKKDRNAAVLGGNCLGRVIALHVLGRHPGEDSRRKGNSGLDLIRTERIRDIL